MNKILPLLQENKIEVDDQFLAVIKTYSHFGIYLRYLGHLHEAKTCIKQVLEIYRIAGAPINDHSEIANCLDSLGGILRDLGNLKEAETSLRMALETRKKLCCSEATDLAISQENLASNDLLKKPEFFQNYVRLATSLDNLGNLLRELGFFPEALKYIHDACELRKQLFPENHEDNIISLNSHGTLLREMGNFNQALEIHEKGLHLAGPNIQTLNCLGLVLLDLGDIETAMRRFQEAFNIAVYTPSNSSQRREIADSIENLGICLGYLGKFHEAIDKLKMVYKIRTSYFGENSYHAANTLCHISFYLHRIGNYNEELENYEKALVIQKEVFGEKHYLVLCQA